MSIYDESPLINYLLFAFVRAQSLPGTLTGRILAASTRKNHNCRSQKRRMMFLLNCILFKLYYYQKPV